MIVSQLSLICLYFQALFVHNRFERKGLAEIEKDFGAVGKETEIIQPSVNVTSSDQAKACEYFNVLL